ncbi:MAG TPA: hypothetical protein VL403_03175 [Candidatus Kryptonia bacterium]|nr:hypothetical protein [Candidatus Kryptonia bacterium]
MQRITMALMLLIAGCHSGCRETLVTKELGKTEADYAASYGTPSKSSMTPDQIAFNVAPGSLLVARVADGRSTEELWLLNDQGVGLPEVIARRAALVLAPDAKPDRVVRFSTPGMPAAEIFEFREGDGVILVERRNGMVTRAALCAQRASCRLLDQTLKAELETDALMARAAEASRRR